jgi:hypothetical protein
MTSFFGMPENSHRSQKGKIQVDCGLASQTIIQNRPRAGRFYAKLSEHSFVLFIGGCVSFLVIQQRVGCATGLWLVFTFARIKYTSSRPERTSFAWRTDYPSADFNLSYRLQQLTSLKVNPEPKVVALDDPQLFHYPWTIMSGVGNLILTDREASVLRAYLLNGGFLMVDDFWGQAMDGRRKAPIRGFSTPSRPIATIPWPSISSSTP